MKRFLVLAALVLGLAACQTEPEGLDVIVGGEVDTVVSVSLPEATRANSANGFDLGSLNSTDYSLRYILEVYLGENCQRHVLVSDNTSVAFPVRLAPGRDYQLVVWADIVEGDSQTDRYYNTDPENGGLKAVSIVESTWNAMDETRDAFTATQTVSAQDIASGAITMTLKRPFAKLRVVATDYDDVVKLGLKPATATVVYSQSMPRTYNALTGIADGADDKSHNITYPATPVYVDATGEYTLFADYFFADDEHNIAKFSLDVYADANKENLIKTNNFTTEIFVEANKLTTIKGDVLTTGANINIDIEDNGAMDTPSYEYNAIGNATAFYEALNNGGEYIVTSDLVIDQAYVPSAQRTATRTTGATAEGKVTTINLNGKTITVTNKTGEPFATVAAGNTLFLEGGNIVLTEDSNGSFIENKGNVIFSNGTLENESNSTTAAVVEGKVIVEENAIVNDDNTTEVENWLADVLANGGTYLFTEDMKAGQIKVTATAPVVLDGNGYTFTYTGSDRAIEIPKDATEANVTIKNLNIALSAGYCERGINFNVTNGVLTIDNVKVSETGTAATYAINLPGSSDNANVVINNSYLRGNIALNVWGENMVINATNTEFVSYDDEESENYTAIALNNDGTTIADGTDVTIEGGKIIALDENGEESNAIRNSTNSGTVTVSESTEVTGILSEPVAIVTYAGYDQFYSCTTLQQAINKAAENSNATVKLIKDITLGEPVMVAENQTIVLDLGGMTLAAKDVANKYAIDNCGTLTIKGNGTINARGIYNGYNGGSSISTAKLTIENGTFNAMGTNGGAAIYNYGVVEVKGGKFESNGGYGLNNQSGASMTITGGEIRGGIYNCGTLSVDGENTSVYQHLSGKHAIYNWSATATINNGAFDSESGNELILADGENSSVTINGGTFDKTAKSWLMGAATGKNITFLINGGTFRGYVNKPEMTVDTFRPYGDPIVVCGGNFNFNPTKFVAEGYAVIEKDNTYTVIPTVLKDGDVLDLGGAKYDGAITVEGNVTIKGDTEIKTLKSTTGCTITIEDGKTLTLNNFSFGSPDNATAEYEIKGGTVTANYGFFQHGKYTLRSNFETGYMYYSYGSDITVHGTFHSQGKGDGLDYVRGKLTIAKGGKSIHDKSLWIGQPASWGAMQASMVIEEGGYVQANSLSVYEGSSLTYSNDADLKYNSVTGTEYITKI